MSELTTLEVQSEIWVTTTFAHMHSWPDAPDRGDLSGLRLDFLRTPHRHLFHVKLCVPVTELNREIEFFDLKSCLEHTICALAFNWKHASCEMMARDLAGMMMTKLKVNKVTCSVSEDGENGATVTLITEG